MTVFNERPLHATGWLRLVVAVALINIVSPRLHAQQGELSLDEYRAAPLTLLQEHAAQDFAGAQTQLGRRAEKSGDYATALQWYRKAVEKDYAPAQVYLGFMYAKGVGVEQDEQEAINWYRKAAEQENSFGQYGLAMAYAKGRGVDQNQQEAVRWFRKAAEQNDAYAQYELGVAYAQGTGLKKDQDAATQWFEKSAAQGNSKAEKALAMLSTKSDHENLRELSWSEYVDAPQNLVEQHAAQGIAVAQTQLGQRAEKSGDYATALGLYREGAAQNNPRAQLSLGLLHARGRRCGAG